MTWTNKKFGDGGLLIGLRTRDSAVCECGLQGQAFAKNMGSRLGKLLGKEADRGKLLKRKSRQVPASLLRLQAFTRSTARRAEGQFRRHWTYIPFVWNVYFCMQLYFGASLSWSPKMVGSEDPDANHQSCHGRSLLFRLPAMLAVISSLRGRVWFGG